jgi:hypothetical protein
VDPSRFSDSDDDSEANSRTVATADDKETFIAIFRFLLYPTLQMNFVEDAKNGACGS